MAKALGLGSRGTCGAQGLGRDRDDELSGDVVLALSSWSLFLALGFLSARGSCAAGRWRSLRQSIGARGLSAARRLSGGARRSEGRLEADAGPWLVSAGPLGIFRAVGCLSGLIRLASKVGVVVPRRHTPRVMWPALVEGRDPGEVCAVGMASRVTRLRARPFDLGARRCAREGLGWW